MPDGTSNPERFDILIPLSVVQLVPVNLMVGVNVKMRGENSTIVYVTVPQAQAIYKALDEGEEPFHLRQSYRRTLSRLRKALKIRGVSL